MRVDKKEIAVKSTLRDLPAWGISLVINLAVLIVLHLIIYQTGGIHRIETIESALDSPEDQQLVFNESVQDQVGTEGIGASMAPSANVATVRGQVETTPQRLMEETQVPQVLPFDSSMEVFREAELAMPTDLVGDTDDLTNQGVEGAMDRITFEIINSLKERQTLVIWMFDASQSLNDRRAAIADRFKNVYAQLANLGAGEGLHTGVVSYGERTRLMTPQPVTDVGDIVEAVRTIQPDESGKENVFAALGTVMDQWKTFHRHEGRWNKLVFIVTDEKGDDAPALLEDVINLAKRFQFRCYTVGNAAVFGQEKGFVVWHYDDGFEEPIAVDQGPETAFPHVLPLPYWGGGDWRLNQMSAAYGPYALTRLCVETGGRYLITEDNAGGYHFDATLMRNYRPDYRPAREIEADINSNPAKAALVGAARLLYADLAQVPVPTLVFFSENDTVLRQEITEAQRPVARTQYWVDKMYDMLKQGERARDSLKEPRWRASFDLAMGRVMAMKVRLMNYNLTLANMKSSPLSFQESGSNEWRLVASSKIDTGPTMRNAAETARGYLKRVIDEHPGTPWEKLAVRELSQDLGWEWKENLRYVPGIENRTDIDPDRLRILLAEEERRQQRQKMEQVKHERPKL